MTPNPYLPSGHEDLSEEDTQRFIHALCDHLASHGVTAVTCQFEAVIGEPCDFEPSFVFLFSRGVHSAPPMVTIRINANTSDDSREGVIVNKIDPLHHFGQSKPVTQWLADDLFAMVARDAQHDLTTRLITLSLDTRSRVCTTSATKVCDEELDPGYPGGGFDRPGV